MKNQSSSKSGREKRPVILISACLLGRRVRYDGAHQRHDWITRELAQKVLWIPICPEVEMGLGVPRDTLRIERGKMIVQKGGKDLTALALRTAARLLESLPEADGAILKSRSPSCGRGSVKLYSDPEHFRRRGTGLFARALRRKFPELPIVEETALDSPAGRREFLRRIRSRCSQRALGAAARDGR